MSQKPIDQLLNAIDNAEFKDQHRKIFITISRLIHKVNLDILDTKKRNEGYCVTFSVPENDIFHLFDDFNLTKEQISSAFSTQWDVPATAHMYNNPFYHILLLCILLGIRTENDSLSTSALTLILFKLWNGRRTSSIPYCDAATMSYVVSNMMNKKYYPNKYATPLDMITQHFAPTIFAKYKSAMAADTSATKRTFDQSFTRLRQLFRSNAVVDLDTGESKYSSGLQPLYFEAKQKGLKITSSSQSDDFDSKTDSSENNFDDQVDNITNFIVMNANPNYPTQFIDFLKNQSKTQDQNIKVIITSLHKMEYVEYIKELLEFIFRRLTELSHQAICSPNFMNEIQKRIISSKHNHEVNQIKAITDKLLQNILETKFSRPYNYMGYSDTNRSQLRRIVIYMLSYNIQKFNCSSN